MKGDASHTITASRESSIMVKFRRRRKEILRDSSIFVNLNFTMDILKDKT